jgi:hypothetical protein
VADVGVEDELDCFAGAELGCLPLTRPLLGGTEPGCCFTPSDLTVGCLFAGEGAEGSSIDPKVTGEGSFAEPGLLRGRLTASFMEFA